ncbi:MAG: TetR/AcrR family transcriptional regulator [Micromonosporaceae bacterium]
MAGSQSRLEIVDRVRVPQADRAEAMRFRLLDATIECLAELGYGRMSTNDIVCRARVSRGALAHHFPTKAELISAAARRLLEGRALEFRRRFGDLGPEQRTPAEALDVLWSFFDDPGAVALIELMVAARHEAELRAVLRSTRDQVMELTGSVFAEFFPDLARATHIRQVLHAVNALFAGLALEGMASGDAGARSAEVRNILKFLVSLAPTQRRNR